MAPADPRPVPATGLRRWWGLAFVLLVATSFATNSALAGLAYAGGANPLTVLLVRSAFAVVALYVVLRIQEVPVALPARQRRVALASGVLMAAYFYGLYAAMARIPVALAVLTFYTYPILTAAYGWAVGRDRPTIVSVLALAASMVGVGLALDVTGAPVDPLGVALSASGAVGFAVLLEISERTRASGDSRPVTLHMLAMTVVCYGTVAAVTGHVAVPHTVSGWVGFVGNPIFFTFAIVSVFVAVTMIGPFKTTLTMYFEPVASAILGLLILGQNLNATQYLGIAVVTGAIAVVHATRGANRG